MTTVTDDAAEIEPATPDEAAAGQVRARRRSVRVARPAWANPEHPAFVWIGVVVAGIGFGLIGLAWGQVAGETQVYLQLPYVVSAGLTGLGLIMVGVTVVNVAAKRRDAVERDRQIDRLVSILEEVEHAVRERPR